MSRGIVLFIVDFNGFILGKRVQLPDKLLSPCQIVELDNKILKNKRYQEVICELPKKGYLFLLAGALYWFVMGILSFFIDDYRLLALCYLIGSGSIFPLAIAISKILKANILTKNPLGVLGGMIGGIQAFYLPQAFLTLPFLLAAIYLISVIGLRIETNDNINLKRWS